MSLLIEEKSQRVAIIENKDEIIGKLQKQLYEVTMATIDFDSACEMIVV